MININLLPEEIRNNIEYSKQNKQLLKYFRMLIIACLLFLISFAFLYVFLIKSNNFFLENIKKSEKSINGYQDVLGEAKKLNEKVQIVENIKKNYRFWSKLNYTLNRVVPAGLYIEKLEPSDGSKLLSAEKNTSSDNDNTKMKIMGFAKTKNDIGLFRDALASQDGFKTVNIDLVKEVESGKNSFSITLFLNKSAVEKGKK